MEHPFGPKQEELDATCDRLRESWNKPVYIGERCENSTGSTWSHDCGVCPYCLSKVPAFDLLVALIKRVWR